MPSYTKKFREGEFYDHTIVQDDGSNAIVGTIRVKPVSILWRPKGAKAFYSVSLEEFNTWMHANGKRVSK